MATRTMRGKGDSRYRCTGVLSLSATWRKGTRPKLLSARVSSASVLDWLFVLSALSISATTFDKNYFMTLQDQDRTDQNLNDRFGHIYATSVPNIVPREALLGKRLIREPTFERCVKSAGM